MTALVQSAGHLRVIPKFHPAAAIYDRSKVAALEEDFDLLKALLDRDAQLPAGGGGQR